MFIDRWRKGRVEYLSSKDIEQSNINFAEHPLNHAAAAYYGTTEFGHDEEIIILTPDGSGDGLSGTIGIGRKGKIDRISSIQKENPMERVCNYYFDPKTMKGKTTEHSF